MNYEMGSIKLVTMNRSSLVDRSRGIEKSRQKSDERMFERDTTEVPDGLTKTGTSIETKLSKMHDIESRFHSDDKLAQYESYLNNKEFNLRDTQKNYTFTTDTWKSN